VNSDVQPLAGFFAFLIVISQVCQKRFTISLLNLVLIVYPLLLLLYINPIDGNDIKIGKYVSLLYGALIFVAFRMVGHKMSGELFSKVVYFYLFFTFLIFVMPDQMIEFQNLFIRDTNSVDVYGYRGVSTLSTEPGLLGGLLVFFLLTNDYLLKSNKLTLKAYGTNFLCITAIILATKSGAGYLYFIIYLVMLSFFSIKNIFNKILLVSILASAMAVIVSSSFGSELGRGFHILEQLSNPSKLIESDTSITGRLLDFWIGIQSVFIYPFGVGVGNNDQAVLNVIFSVGGFLASYYSKGETIGLISSFSYLTVVYGLFFIVYILFMYIYIARCGIPNKFFSFLFLSISFSAAFPAIWVLLLYRKSK
jgi:hypothetical protein